MKSEKITVRELCRMVLQKVNEPKTVNEVWDIAVKKGYDKMYDSKAENPKANVNSFLSTESESDGEIQRDESQNPYRYSLRYPPIFDDKDDEDAKKRVEQIIDNAKQQAQRIIDGAEQQAEQTVVDAEQKAKKIIGDAKVDAENAKVDGITLIPETDKIIERFEKIEQLINELKLSQAEGFKNLDPLIENKLFEARIKGQPSRKVRR